MVDALITLYEHNETEFKTNGLGDLGEAASCSVYEQRNGEFELTMEYPVMGRHFSDLVTRRIIFAKPNPYSDPQPFRIYNISKPINGLISISAHHVSYDLSGYALAPFEADGLVDVFNQINKQMTESWNSSMPSFKFTTSKMESTGKFSLLSPCNARALLGGSEGTILDRWPGEYTWDRWTVRYDQNRGTDRGVVIEYGKNLTDFTQEENCEECWTAVYPYYYTDPQTDQSGNVSGGLTQLSEKIIKLSGTYDHQKILVLDLTSEFTEKPTEVQLRERANQYIQDNKLDSPKISLTVSFVPLSQIEGYEKYRALETVHLCDTVTVLFPLLNVSTSIQCIGTTYNVLTGKYDTIELGDPVSNLATTIGAPDGSIHQAFQENRKYVEGMSESLSKLILEGSGLYSTQQKQPNGSSIWLLHDKPRLEDSMIVIRITDAGIGLSTDGGKSYPYGYTVTGKMVMDFIAANGIECSWLKAGTLNLDILSLAGTICGLMQGYGLTGDGRTTQGICIFGNGRDSSGNAKPPYVIVTNAGVRIQISSTESVYFSGGFAGFTGLNITTTGSVNATTALATGNKTAAKYDSEKDLMQISTEAVRTWVSGRQAYLGEDVDGHETYLRGSLIQASRTIKVSSDERMKKDIQLLDDIYLRFMDHLNPIGFRYKDEDSTAPLHVGYIAQNLDQALRDEGMQRSQLAALGEYKTENGDERFSIAYEELIPLLHLKIKKLEEEVKHLKEGMIL